MRVIEREEREKERERERKRERLRERQTARQTYRQTRRQTNREEVGKKEISLCYDISSAIHSMQNRCFGGIFHVSFTRVDILHIAKAQAVEEIFFFAQQRNWSVTEAEQTIQTE